MGDSALIPVRYYGKSSLHLPLRIESASATCHACGPQLMIRRYGVQQGFFEVFNLSQDILHPS